MANHTYPNIDRIWKDHLCTECGACYGVCPKKNIKVQRAGDRDYVFRVVDPSRCGQCDLCIKICPGFNVDFGWLHRTMFQDRVPDAWFGVVMDTLLTRATDTDAIRRGASGGTATTLLEFSLKTGRIDGALVVGMSRTTPHEPRIFIARSVDELRSASQSKYCPAPTCMSFREVLDTPGRYAMVGLPCHIHALRTAQSVFPKLRRRIVFTAGLFCGPGPSFLMIDHLLHRRGISLDEIKRFYFRDKRAHDGTWPGGILAELSSGEQVHIPLEKYLYAQTLFTRRRCNVCPDYSAEFSDLSMGDAHITDFWSPPQTYECPDGRILSGAEGWNALVVRTDTGKRWIDAARDSDKLDVAPLPFSKLKQGMASPCYRKKEEFWARLKIRSLLPGQVPHFSGLIECKPLTAKQLIQPLLRIIIGEAIQYSSVQQMLERIPEKVL